MPRIKSISTHAASGRAGGCATTFLAVFLGLFVIAGSAIGFLMSAQPLYRAYLARGWMPTACEVVSSRIIYSDGTSRPDIVYRYTIGGRQYTADRYNFLPGTTSDSTVPGVVAKHKPGTTFECYVDPADPTNAVINRTPTLWYFGGVAFFVMFAGIPGVIAAVVMRSRRRADTAQRALSGGGSGDVSGAVAGSRFGHAPLAADGGPIVLKPSASPVAKLVTITLVCLFWNGIVGIFTVIEYQMFMRGDSFGWAMALFLLLFQLVGVALLVAVPYQLLAMANPRPIITLSRGSLPLGGSATFTWELNGTA